MTQPTTQHSSSSISDQTMELPDVSTFAMSSGRDLRICVVGDSYITGYGDPRSLGWVGRVTARTPQSDIDLTMHTLGIRGETSSGLLSRWRSETTRRWGASADNRLVIATGAEDIRQGVSLARTRLNLANMVDDATSEGLRPFVVGIPPWADRSWHDTQQAVHEAQRDVCERRDIPYVNCFEPLAEHTQWYADLDAGDGVHPGQAGYGLLAWLVLHCGWTSWLGLEDNPPS
ncbi:MAG: GDSL-type esterase/lipase family protein [Actinomycetota bacterium]